MCPPPPTQFPPKTPPPPPPPPIVRRKLPQSAGTTTYSTQITGNRRPAIGHGNGCGGSVPRRGCCCCRNSARLARCSALPPSLPKPVAHTSPPNSFLWAAIPISAIVLNPDAISTAPAKALVAAANALLAHCGGDCVGVEYDRGCVGVARRVDCSCHAT